MSLGQNYPGDIPRIITDTITVYPNVFYSEYGLDRLRDHAIMASGSSKLTPGTPLVYVAGSTTNVKAYQFGQIASVSSTAITMQDDHEDRFVAGDVVWACDLNFGNRQRLGAITNVNSTTHVITVTVAPFGMLTGYLYVAKPDGSTATSSAATAVAGTPWYKVTVTAGHENFFKVGGFCYETATGGTGLYNLGKVELIDYVNHEVYVAVATTNNSGGKLIPGGELPDIIGITYWAQEALDSAGTASDQVVFYVTDCVLLAGSLGLYTTTYDTVVKTKVMQDLPRVTITSKEFKD